MYLEKFGWSFLANLMPLIITPITLLVLTRYLSPEEFAVVALVTVVIALLKILKDGGLSQIVIQSKSTNTRNVLFTIQLIICIFLVVLIWIFAPYIAILIGNKEVEEPLRYASLELLVLPILEIPILASMRDLNFKPHFYRKTLVPILIGLFSIFFAANDYGYWAIIYGTLVGTYLSVAIMTFKSSWKLKLDFNFTKITPYLNFGGNLFLQSILSWVMNSLDKAFLSNHNDKASVGYYEVASRVSYLPFSLISVPTNQVLYPVMRKDKLKNNDIRKFYLISSRLMAYAVLPITCFILFYSEEIIRLILGEQWLIVKDILPPFILVSLAATFVTINVEVYKAIDKTIVMTRFMLARVLITIPVYWFSAMSGLLHLAYARAILAFLFSPINTLILLRNSNIFLKDYLVSLRKPVLISMGLSVIFFIGESNIFDFNSFYMAIFFTLLVYLYILIKEFVPIIKKDVGT